MAPSLVFQQKPVKSKLKCGVSHLNIGSIKFSVAVDRFCTQQQQPGVERCYNLQLLVLLVYLSHIGANHNTENSETQE